MPMMDGMGPYGGSGPMTGMQQGMQRQDNDPMGRNVTNELLKKFSHFDSHRKRWDERSIKWYQQYVGWKKEIEKLKGKVANLHIPRTYQQVDTIRSRIVTAFFRNRPYCDFLAEPEGTDPESMRVSEDKANVAAALVDQQLEKNQIVSKFYDFVTSLLVFPAAIMSVGWKYEQDYVKKKMPQPEIIQHPLFGPQFTGRYILQIMENIETVWDDNEIQVVDYFDFWPDPDRSSLDSARGVFHREWLTEEELFQMLEWLRQQGEGIIYPIDWEKLGEAGSSLERGNRARLASIGMTSDSGQEIYSNTDDPQDKKNKEYMILHYWEDNRHAILVNKQQCVYDGPSPYWRHREKPFVFASYEPMPNEMYGMSAIQIISDLQEEENTQHNQRIDNVSRIINKGWIRRKGSDIPNSALVSYPGMILDVPDIHNDLKPIDMGNMPTAAYLEPDLIAQIMENTLATPPVIRGAESRRKETATTNILQNDNASMRFEVKIRLFESLGIKRLFRQMDMNNQQFIDASRLVKIGQDDAAQWRTVHPTELIGERDYMPSGADTDPGANKEVRREQLGQMIGQLMQYTQFLSSMGAPQIVNFEELIKEWIKTFDIRNSQKFLFSDEEMMQQMMAMMTMGGGIAPPGGMIPGMDRTIPNAMPNNPQMGVMQNIARG
jgi:hypothetical protein